MITTEFWQELVDTLEAGQAAFLVIVVDSSSGSPGTPGAALLVRPDGSQVGTVGGGIMEYNILATARDAIESQSFDTCLDVLWHRKEAPGTPSGMICSGSQTNVYHLCRPIENLEAFRQVLEASRTHGTETLRMSRAGIDIIHTDEAAPIFVDPEGWEARIRIAVHRRIAIIGGGHCGRALSHAMRRLDYIVSVLDTRADATLFTGNEDAHHRMVIGDYREAGGRIALPQRTSAVVMTTDYPSDVQALIGILPLPFPFVGVMGSLAKLNHIRADLRRAGFGEDDLARLHAPVGLPIGSHTPEEIAISIAAQFIRDASAEA